jgi:tetratricopeptide (TPR) repeat protein
MKHYLFTALLFCVLGTQAQDKSFTDLFQAAFNCRTCADSIQIALYTKAINHGVTHTVDVYNFHDALVNRGRLYAEAGNFQAAIEDFELALATGPEDYAIRQELATTYLQNGQFQEALQQFDMYINRVEAEKKEMLAFYSPDQTNDPEEKSEYREMQKRSETNWNATLAMAYNNRGICKGQMRNHRAACVDFRKAYEAGMRELKSFLDAECK